MLFTSYLALMRIVHDDVVDMGYASSSVMDLYDHRTPQFAYFEKITQVAEKASPGCADSVRSALDKVNSYVRDAAAETDDDSMTIDSLAEKLGICVETIPEYINTHALLAQELGMIIASHFAENNMDYYPPSEDQVMVQGCKIFQDPNLSASEKVSSFLRMQKRFEVCYAMTADLPPGPKGTISAADWSGVGEGQAGWMWDFQTCVLAPACGMSEKSMFIPRKWSMEWLTEHCERRFGVTPELDRMVTQFHFDKLENVTRLLLTNGGNDGWSVASIPEDLPANIEVIVFPNGSHHSDLTHFGPIKADTPDIKDGHARIGDLVGGWLDQVWAENGKA
jgi:lysosomal Pro-X carboxypeptidase